MSTKEEIIVKIQDTYNNLKHVPSRSEFIRSSGISEYHVLKYFNSWTDAVSASGLEPNKQCVKIEPELLLKNWGEFVRDKRRIPTRDQYRREGNISVGTFDKNIGPWSIVPMKFREYAMNKPEWVDVVALIPAEQKEKRLFENNEEQPTHSKNKNIKLNNRPTYGNPIDFRGLRHEPVNEQGVVFLFGMVARELGYLVESIQTGYPDCEAKRQIDKDKWQRVRIEFEYESRNFYEHGHSPDGCDLIVCWRHNWRECPSNIEVVELRKIIMTLSNEE